MGKGGAAVLATGLCLGLQSALLDPNMALFGHAHLKLDPGELGLMFAASSIAGLVFGFVVPMLSDRLDDRRRLVALLALVAAAGYAGLGLSSGLAGALAVLVLVLGPPAGLGAVFYAHVRQVDGDGRRLVRVRSLHSVAWVTGPAIGTLTVQHAGFPALFALAAGLSLAVAALSAVLPPVRPIEHGGPARPVGPGRGRFWYTVVAFVGLQAAGFLNNTAMPIVAVDEIGAPVGRIGFLFGTCALIEIPLFLALPAMIRRWGEGRLLALGCLAGLGYALAIATAPSYTGLLAAQPLSAVFVVTVAGIGLLRLLDSLPEKPGLSSGIHDNTGRIAVLAASPLVGLVASAADTYRALPGAAAALILASGVLLFLARVDRA
jgi:SET family sugar efflux transporter-like MFS transporter